jgi:hypothetical protein
MTIRKVCIPLGDGTRVTLIVAGQLNAADQRLKAWGHMAVTQFLVRWSQRPSQKSPRLQLKVHDRFMAGRN